MYGTVSRFKLRAGQENALVAQLREFEAAKVAGFQHVYIYRSDADPNQYFMAVVFAGKDAYWANANSPEQDARYEKFRELLQADPEWHDGEIIHAQ